METAGKVVRLAKKYQAAAVKVDDAGLGSGVTDRLKEQGLPGVVGLVAVLGGLAAVRWYYRRQVTHLPGFTRVPTTLAPSTPSGAPPVGPRSSQTGSSAKALDGTTGSPPQPAPSGS